MAATIRPDPAASSGEISRARASGAFRPDLEGLRAVAVLLVLLYHAGVPGLAGGYVGVDVFFVLSGFLITGLLLREVAATGRVDLAGFYARRARRLLPAAMLVIVATLIASIVLLPALQVVGVAQDAAASALYASNILFAVQATDYLQADLLPSPLLHYWSLGVEEQFYLVWPALLMLVATRMGRPRPGWTRRIGLTVVLVAVGSFALSLVLTQVAQPWAFFSLPTRAWELGLGALLAVAGSRLAAVPRPAATILGWVGLTLVVLAGFVLDAATPFPGVAALLPTIGAALVILAGVGLSAPADGSPTDRMGPTSPAAAAGATSVRVPPVAALLSTGPARFLGRISYSLYLWHWPIIVIPAAALGTDLPLPVTLALAALAIPVAALSQRWVEEPIRHGRFVGILPRRNIALALVASLAVAVIAVNVGRTILPGPVLAGVAGAEERDLPPLDAGAAWLPSTTTGSPSGGGATGDPALTPAASPATTASPGGSGSASPTAGTAADPDASLPPSAPGPVPPDLLPPLTSVHDDAPAIYGDGCHADQGTTVPKDCAYGDLASDIVVTLIGDSHAAQWFPALERLATARHWRLVPLTKSACPAADVTVWNSTFKRPYTECDAWRDAVFARVEALHPALTIVSDSRSYQLIEAGDPVPVASATDQWDAGLQQSLARFRAASGSVAVIADTPRAHGDPAVCLSGHLDDALACANPASAAIDVTWLDGERAGAEVAGVAFVDPTRWVCPSDPCPVVIDRYLVFRDNHHLTTVFSRALAGALEQALPAIPAGGG